MFCMGKKMRGEMRQSNRWFLRRTAWTLLLVWPLFALVLALPPICHLAAPQSSTRHASAHDTESHPHRANVTTAAHTGSASGEACLDLRDLDLGTSAGSDPETKVADPPLHISVATFRALNEVRALSMRACRPPPAPQLPFYKRTLRLLI